MSFPSDPFLTERNLFNVTRNFAFIGIMALGMTAVVITGGIDLSVGSVMGLAGVLTGLMMESGYDFWVGIGAGLFAAACIGFVNGVLIASVGMPPFGVTLGMLSLARSLAVVFYNNRNISVFVPDAKAPIALCAGCTFAAVNPVTIPALPVIRFVF